MSAAAVDVRVELGIVTYTWKGEAAELFKDHCGATIDSVYYSKDRRASWGCVVSLFTRKTIATERQYTLHRLGSACSTCETPSYVSGGQAL